MKAPADTPDIEALLAHSTWLEGFAMAIASDSHRAADAVQDTWVALLEGRMRSNQAPESWLRTVLGNFVKLSQRREHASMRREQHAAQPEALDNSHSPPEIIARADLQRRLLTAVMELEEPYRAALLMSAKLKVITVLAAAALAAGYALTSDKPEERGSRVQEFVVHHEPEK